MTEEIEKNEPSQDTILFGNLTSKNPSFQVSFQPVAP